MPTENTKGYLKIGDVARLVGVSPSVIRAWESLGLTRPQRTASRYRLYTTEDVKILKRARFLRRVRGLNAPAIGATVSFVFRPMERRAALVCAFEISARAEIYRSQLSPKRWGFQ